MKFTSLILIFLSLALTGCYQDKNQGHDLLYNVSEMDLRIAKSRWLQFAASNPSYNLQQTQTTGFGSTQMMATVIAGNIINCTVITNFLNDINQQPCGNDSFPSVLAHFDILEGAFQNNAFSVQAQFHPELGYPTSIGIDYSPEIADEEASLSLSIGLL